MDEWWRDLRMLRALLNDPPPPAAPPSRDRRTAGRSERHHRNRLIALFALMLFGSFAAGFCLFLATPW
jgi:hypothetical protein